MPRDWEKQTEYKENRQLTEVSCRFFLFRAHCLGQVYAVAAAVVYIDAVAREGTAVKVR